MISRAVQFGAVAVVTTVAAAWALLPAAARAQELGAASSSSRAGGVVEQVALTVGPGDVGLAGVVRPGTWAPLRVTVENRSTLPREVLCRWRLPDSEGDLVQAQRRVTLTPGVASTVWLYGCPPFSTRDDVTWPVEVVEVVDNEPGAVLASAEVRPAVVLPATVRVVGVTDARMLGLDAFEEDHTHQEKTHVLRGLSPRELPDQWLGLELLDALIWTRDGGDPGDPAVPTAAVDQWVRRGGHLVAVVPSVLNPWPQSPLGGLWGGVRAERIENASFPARLGPSVPQRISMHALTLPPPSGSVPPATTLVADDLGQGVVVAVAAGFGRVTIVGVDLTDPAVERGGLWRPYVERGLWNDVFGWRGPAWRKDYVESQLQQNEFLRQTLQPAELGWVIPNRVARGRTVAATLTLAILLFAVYWLVAGPVMQAVLHARRAVKYSWLAFVGVVAVASAVAWGGAWLLRPSAASVAHVSVIDAVAGQEAVRVQSWVSLYVPSYGRAALLLDPGKASPGAVWSSPGMDPGAQPGSFIDQQRYDVDATTPARAVLFGDDDATAALRAAVALPARSTTRPLRLQYVGALPDGGSAATGGAGLWGLPRGQVRLDNGVPRGSLTHQLPGTLRNVRVIFCPGGAAPDNEPMVLAAGDWDPGQTLTIDGGFTRGGSLVLRRGEQWGGWLGDLIGQKAGQLQQGPAAGEAAPLPASELVRHLWMLSFFDTLPPPQFRKPADAPAFSVLRGPNYHRAIGRGLDLTPRLAWRQVLVIGLLEDAPLPVPLELGGATVPADPGHAATMIRWSMPLQ